jgi:alpha-beta hydrolase superfamily lysophospholipase
MARGGQWDEIRLESGDGGTVQAYWRPGSRGSALLCHGRVYDAESFREYSDEMAESGYAVMRINFRGYHCSRPGTKGPDARYEDVLAAARWLGNTTGRPVVALGASMGGSAVFRAAAETAAPFRALVGWSPMAIDGGAAQRLTMPKLVVWSRDEQAAPMIADYYRQLPDPKANHVFFGTAHAQQLLADESRGPLAGLVMDFLSANA